MFKPSFDNFRAAVRNHPPNFGDFMRLESAVESKRKIIHPDFAFAPGFENMNVHPFGQVVAVKADPITVVDENCWHGRRKPGFISISLRAPSNFARFARIFRGARAANHRACPRRSRLWIENT
jgi:hypothetical protein